MYTTHLTIIKGKSETKALMHLARSIHQGRGLRFPCNDRTDEVDKLSYVLSIMDLSLRSIKTNRWAADNFNKYVTSMCQASPKNRVKRGFLLPVLLASGLLSQSWPEPSKQRESPPEEKRLVNSWLLRQLERALLLLVAWKNRTVTGLISFRWSAAPSCCHGVLLSLLNVCL